MINLKNIGHTITRLPHEAHGSIASAWDTSANILFCAYGPAKSSSEIQLYEIEHHTAETHNVRLIAGWEFPHGQSEDNNETLINLHYFADDLSFCLILSGGDIVIIRREPKDNESRVEIAGSVDAGIAAARALAD